jgi:hypothetical protein
VKVQIIYLDPHDDHVSARDKLGWAKAPRTLLVWPRRGRVLTRQLDLVLLQRWAKRNSRQIGLVTHDPDVIEHAQTLGIPVFDSVEHISEEMWRRPARILRHKPLKPERTSLLEEQPPRPPSQAQPPTRLSKFLRVFSSTLALAAIVILIAVLFPSADIRITPTTSTYEMDTTILVDPSAKEPDLDGIVPARLASISVTDNLRQTTSGRINVPLHPASGEVEFTNLTSDPITIQRGTGLRSSLMPDLRFEVQRSIELAGDEGAQATGSVRCTIPGTVGNLPITAIDSIEGTLGLQIIVTNPEPFSGGENESRAAVAASDIEALDHELKQRLLAQAASSFREGLDVDEILLEESLQTVNIQERTVDPQIGEPGASVAMELVIEVSGLIYRDGDLDTAVSHTLNASLPPNTSLVPGTLNYISDIDSSEHNESVSILHIVAEQDTYQPIDVQSLQLGLRSLPLDKATSFLEQRIDLEGKPVIKLSPSWLPRLPFLPMRISIHYPWGPN